jgi:hypothetical protein
MRLLRHIAEGRIVPPRQMDARIPVALDAVLTRALAPQPHARFASMRELGEALLPFASLGMRHMWHGAFTDETGQGDPELDSSVVEVPARGAPAEHAPSLPPEPTPPSSVVLSPRISSGRVAKPPLPGPSKGPVSSRRFNSVGVERHEEPSSFHRSALARLFFLTIALCALAMSIVLIAQELDYLGASKSADSQR